MALRIDGAGSRSGAIRNTANVSTSKAVAPRTSRKSTTTTYIPSPQQIGGTTYRIPSPQQIGGTVAPVDERTAAPVNPGGSDVGFSQDPSVTGPTPDVAPQPPRLSDEDFLAQGGDSIYGEQLAALKKALADYQSEQGVQKGRYGNDFEEGSRRLGWKDRDGFEGKEDAGQWDFEDTNFAAGRGFKGQRDDFASRGLLQSSDYNDARTMLERNLNDQRNSMVQDRTRFTDDLAAQLAAFQAENTGAQKSAAQEALLRRASGLIAR